MDIVLSKIGVKCAYLIFSDVQNLLSFQTIIISGKDPQVFTGNLWVYCAC